MMCVGCMRGQWHPEGGQRSRSGLDADRGGALEMLGFSRRCDRVSGPLVKIAEPQLPES